MNGETLSTRFAYHYDLTLSLALPGPEFSAEDRRTLENGINSYNERSIYMNNPKHISLLEWERTTSRSGSPPPRC